MDIIPDNNKKTNVEYESNDCNKLFDIELDLLSKFKSICAKYHLEYFASSGTLLGAVRHNGFLPWDDDIDLFMMWDDYKKFLEVAPLECQFPYFFQSHLTENEGEASAARLRRTDTTGCTKWEYDNISDIDYNRGIFIDIFPLFYVPNTKIMRWLQKKRVTLWWKCIRGHDYIREVQLGKNGNLAYKKYVKIYKFFSIFVDIKKMKNKYLNACAMPKFAKKEVGATSSRCHAQNLMWPAAWYEKTVELQFEDTTIKCPSEYEKVLTKQYGDWAIPVNNGARHEMYVLDTTKSYKEYFK